MHKLYFDQIQLLLFYFVPYRSAPHHSLLFKNRCKAYRGQKAFQGPDPLKKTDSPSPTAVNSSSAGASRSHPQCWNVDCLDLEQVLYRQWSLLCVHEFRSSVISRRHCWSYPPRLLALMIISFQKDPWFLQVWLWCRCPFILYTVTSHESLYELLFMTQRNLSGEIFHGTKLGDSRISSAYQGHRQNSNPTLKQPRVWRKAQFLG